MGIITSIFLQICRSEETWVKAPLYLLIMEGKWWTFCSIPQLDATAKHVVFCCKKQSGHPRSLTTRPWKMMGLEDNPFLLGPGIFSGVNSLLNFRWYPSVLQLCQTPHVRLWSFPILATCFHPSEVDYSGQVCGYSPGVEDEGLFRAVSGEFSMLLT